MLPEFLSCTRSLGMGECPPGVNFLDLNPQFPPGTRQALEKSAGWVGGELIITGGDVCPALPGLSVFREKLEL